MANPVTDVLGRIPRPVPSRTGVLLGLYTLALFLFFLPLTFPHELVALRVTRQIEAQTGWTIRFENVRLVPWAGYRFSRLSVHPGREGGADLLTVRSVDLRPTMQSMLRGSLSSFVFAGDLYRGEVAGSLIAAGTRTFTLDWRDLDLSAFPALGQLVAGTWQGRFSGDLRTTLADQIQDAEGEGSLTLRGASLTGGNASGFAVPDLTGVGGDGDLALKGGRLEIRSLKLTGDQVDIDLRGQVYLRTPFSESVLNATVTATPVPGNPGVDGLLRIAAGGKPPAGGAYKYTLYGKIGAPRLR